VTYRTRRDEGRVVAAAPRPGSKRRALWNRLHDHRGEWVEFHYSDYAASANGAYQIAEVFRTEYGLDIETAGSPNLCRWRLRPPRN
jgi:hypothetical protein